MIKPIRTDKYGNPPTGAVIRAINALIEEHNELLRLWDMSENDDSGKNDDEYYAGMVSLVRACLDPNEGGPVPGDLP